VSPGDEIDKKDEELGAPPRVRRVPVPRLGAGPVIAPYKCGRAPVRSICSCDSGRTGDKVSAPDPAMAPLGADDEAAGTPPSPAAIALTRRMESSRPHQSEPRTGLGHAWML